MEPRISLVTLGVRDVARSAAFYRDGMGWKRSPAGDDDVAFFQVGGMIFSLFRLDSLVDDANVGSAGAGFAGMSLAQNVASRAQVDAVMAEAEAAGATVLRPAQEAFWGGYHGYFADLDGFAWEIAWNPHFPLADDGTISLPG